jgi:predicted O-methyltransferase YrrM
VAAVGPGTGAVLRLLATTSGARAVAEIGTGAGVSGLYLLRGMRPDGVLTTVDPEPEYQRAAKESFAEAGFLPGRARFIPGRALEVLPRLADGGYDVVFCDGDRAEYMEYFGEALRLLRTGGVVCFAGVLDEERVADPTRHDPETQTLRDLLLRIREDGSLAASLLPVDGGLLCAAKRI